MDLGTGWVTDPCHPDRSWKTQSLSWWHVALDGSCSCGVPTYAKVDGDGIRMQHGENPEHSRWFSLDNLNEIGGCLDHRNSWYEWTKALHAFERGESGWMDSGGLSSGSASSEPFGAPSES